MRSLILAACLVATANGHGNLLYPPTWQDASGFFGAFVVDPYQVSSVGSLSVPCGLGRHRHVQIHIKSN